MELPKINWPRKFPVTWYQSCRDHHCFLLTHDWIRHWFLHRHEILRHHTIMTPPTSSYCFPYVSSSHAASLCRITHITPLPHVSCYYPHTSCYFISPLCISFLLTRCSTLWMLSQPTVCTVSFPWFNTGLSATYAIKCHISIFTAAAMSQSTSQFVTPLAYRDTSIACLTYTYGANT